MNRYSVNNNQNILIIVDHKHRDLPTLSLIGYHLEKYGHRITYSPTGFVMENFAEINPDVIIIPKPSYSYVNQMQWKLEGRKIIVIESEGNNQDKFFEYNIVVFPDLYIFWNDEVKSIYEKKFIKNNVNYMVKGFPRSDFFLEPLKHIFNKEKIKSSLGIKNENKILTIALSTQDSNFSNKRLEERKKRHNRKTKKSTNYYENIINRKKLKKITSEFLISASKKYGNKINFVIKPHPHESVLYWYDLLKKNKLKNCYLMVGKAINDLLAISDLHMAHNCCTTIPEAMMHGKKTIDLQTDQSPNLFSLEHLNIADYKVTTSKEILEILEIFLKKIDKKMNNKRIDEYVKKYFTVFNGKICKSYASSIDKFLRNPNNEKNNLNFTNRIKLKTFQFSPNKLYKSLQLNKEYEKKD